MTISSLLFDTYHRYKKGTEQVVHWLAATARATGTVNEVFDDRSHQAKKPMKTKTDYEIPVETLIRLAKAAAANPATMVPRLTFQTLHDVISQHKDCAEWYRANPQSKDAIEVDKHNRGHRHFIDILEDVSRILGPREEKTKEKRKNFAPPNTSTTQLANRFEHLEVEEPPVFDHELLALHQQQDTAQSNKKKEGEKDKATYHMDDPAEEIEVMLYCFMKDLTGIRIFVRDTWKQYKDRQVTLNTAATVMNTAIGVMKRMNEDLAEKYPQFEGHDMTLRVFLEGPKKWRDDVADEEAVFLEYQHDGSELLLCDRIYSFLEVLFTHRPDGMPLYREEAIDWPSLSPGEKRLARCLSGLAVISTLR